jgi:hypothetical protein
VAQSIQDFAGQIEHRIFVRNGTVSMIMNHDQGTAKDRMDVWLKMVKSTEILRAELDMQLRYVWRRLVKESRYYRHCFVSIRNGTFSF